MVIAEGTESGVDGVVAGVDDTSPKPESVRELFDREYDGQVRRAALVLGDVDAAHDVVQAVFVKMSQRWERIDKPVHYLARSVMNGCRNELRRRSRFRLLRDPPEVSASRPEHPMFDVLARLPVNEREAVVLRFYGGASYREIAETLGCAEGSVGPWINRALQRLKGELDGND